MKELVIISGKGGSGKTSISSSFISLAKKCVICDCDVEAPNLHILIKPGIEITQDYYGLPKARIDLETCIECDRCIDLCRFDAIKDYIVSEDDCEGCSLCSRICPVDAITMINHVCGQSHQSKTLYGKMFHAHLGIGEQNSGKLVASLRESAHRFADKEKEELIITDGPPGIGCPTIATLTGANLAAIIAEPTMSAIHDMLRTMELCNHFNINHGVIINKSDLNMEKTQEIYEHCQKAGIPVFGEIPFDKSFRDAINNLLSPVDYSIDIKEIIEPVWEKVKAKLLAE